MFLEHESLNERCLASCWSLHCRISVEEYLCKSHTKDLWFLDAQIWISFHIDTYHPFMQQ